MTQNTNHQDDVLKLLITYGLREFAKVDYPTSGKRGVYEDVAESYKSFDMSSELADKMVKPIYHYLIKHFLQADALLDTTDPSQSGVYIKKRPGTDISLLLLNKFVRNSVVEDIFSKDSEKELTWRDYLLANIEIHGYRDSFNELVDIYNRSIREAHEKFSDRKPYQGQVATFSP